jgi:TatD DNase family protein
LDLGFYISFSGIVTFPKAHQIQECAKIVPNDKYLIETDAPFLAPVPHRGKRNEPAFVENVANFMADLRSTELITIAQESSKNAEDLFKFNLLN